MLKLIKELCISGKDKIEIMNRVNTFFKIDYKVCSFKHLKLQAFHGDWLEKLSEQEKIVQGWRQLETKKKENTSELYAEKLFQLFHQ